MAPFNDPSLNKDSSFADFLRAIARAGSPSAAAEDDLRPLLDENSTVLQPNATIADQLRAWGLLDRTPPPSPPQAVQHLPEQEVFERNRRYVEMLHQDRRIVFNPLHWDWELAPPGDGRLDFATAAQGNWASLQWGVRDADEVYWRMRADAAFAREVQVNDVDLIWIPQEHPIYNTHEFDLQMEMYDAERFLLDWPEEWTLPPAAAENAVAEDSLVGLEKEVVAETENAAQEERPVKPADEQAEIDEPTVTEADKPATEEPADGNTANNTEQPAQNQKPPTKLILKLTPKKLTIKLNLSKTASNPPKKPASSDDEEPASPVSTSTMKKPAPGARTKAPPGYKPVGGLPGNPDHYVLPNGERYDDKFDIDWKNPDHCWHAQRWLDQRKRRMGLGGFTHIPYNLEEEAFLQQWWDHFGSTYDEDDLADSFAREFPEEPRGGKAINEKLKRIASKVLNLNAGSRAGTHQRPRPDQKHAYAARLRAWQSILNKWRKDHQAQSGTTKGTKRTKKPGDTSDSDSESEVLPKKKTKKR